MSTIAKPPLYRITAIQLIVTLLSCGLISIKDAVAGYSFLIGCLIQIAGSAYFARLAYRYQGARQVKTMVQAMYLGQSGKILLAAALFASVFIFVRPLDALLVFIGYISMLIIHSVIAARLIKRKIHF